MAEGNHPLVSTDSGGSPAEIDIGINRSIEGSVAHNSIMADGGDAGLERFLQQQRSDLMFELRRIQHGERPVTGQNNRENIAKFMEKHSHEAEGADGKTNIPANVDAVEEHRPEAVVVEVQGVVEQRRVSSMLQSSNFRRHLENIIRGSITSARQSVSSTASRTRAFNSPQPAGADVAAVSRSRSGSEETLESISEETTAAAASPSVGRASAPQPRVRQAQPLPPPARPARVLPASENVEQGGEGTWDTISQVHHEEMVYEISDLLHQRLVSSALGSEFRTVMELHVQNQQSRTGTDGEAVADFIRNIPQSQEHVPNDFSHLGINPGFMDDNSDNISITGISATAVPYTQTNLHVSRELHSLKAQMEEMKNMMKLSFDLQMDIQRSIRQEVAAALASVTGQGATASAAAPQVHSTPVNDTHCLICLDNHSDSVLYQCGHMCVCFGCGKNLMLRGNAKCPVCRAPIKDVIRAYKTNID